MLIIRQEQLKMFQPLADAAFVRRVVEYLRENHAYEMVQLPKGVFTVEQIDDESLYEMVRNGIARARVYGLSWESTLCAFVVLMFVAAPNFEDHPLIKYVLKDESISPDSRINNLLGRTSDQNWVAVKQGYDSNAWYLQSQE